MKFVQSLSKPSLGDRSDMHAMKIQWSFLKFSGLFQATVKYIEDFYKKISTFTEQFLTKHDTHPSVNEILVYSNDGPSLFLGDRSDILVMKIQSLLKMFFSWNTELHLANLDKEHPGWVKINLKLG